MASMNKTGYNPTKIERPRSVFAMEKRHITTMQIGELTPILCEEVLPGDTFSLDVASMIRAAAPFVSPIYGDLTLSIFAFFAPNRLLWEHWHQFCGQNDEGAWTSNYKYVIPKGLYSPVTGSLGDHLGLPLTKNVTPNMYINELPARAYYRIWNEYFRNENTDTPKLITYGDSQNQIDEYQSGSATPTFLYTRSLLKVSKFHDYFTNCLPAPQKGPSVSIPIGDSAPIQITNLTTGSSTYPLYYDEGNIKTNNNVIPQGVNSTIKNLSVNLSNAAATTINEWRLAAQTQIFYETCARYGTRYNELVYGLFGVKTGDTRAYRCEMLGGVHIPLKMQEVVANSSSADNSQTQYALGQQVVKLTNGDNSSLCTKSFVEHGYLMVLCCVRQKQQYWQGIERKWKRNTFLDFYNPIYDNIGETPVYQNELYADPSNTGTPSSAGQTSWDDTGKNVLGYQEAWAEYRYWKDDITGYMRPTELPTYTFAQTFTEEPTLQNIMAEDRKAFQRCSALTSLDYDLMCDFVIHGKVARPMSVRSIPGLLDHHSI